jgi:hypothetical protein
MKPSRRFPYSISHVTLFVTSLVLAGGGLAGVLQGKATGWLVLIFFLLCAAAQAAAPWISARWKKKAVLSTLTVDDWGVRRHLSDGQEESLAWAELHQVMILTNADGPFADDLYFALLSARHSGVLVNQSLAAEHHLLGTLQQRLPDLDNEAIIRAMGSTQEARFVIWPPEKKG